MPEVKPAIETLAKIKVVGVGGGGGSAVNRMVSVKIKGVDFIAVNTDLQALHCNMAPQKVHIGKTVTRGLGAGMNPDLGYKAAEENQNEIREAVKDSDMIFITCGLGGGTGSGAAPLVADIARANGALTVAVITRPFSFEGSQRKEIAERAYAALLEKVDAIIAIPNDRILQVVDKNTTMLEAFQIIDDVLRQGVQGIAEVITVPGQINVDFADVRAIMQESGSALMGIGRATGENRAVEAAKAAIASPLLDLSIEGAKGILFIMAGSHKLGMHEAAEAAKVITANADENAKIIWGTVIDDNLKDEVKVTVIATGFDRRDLGVPRPSSASRPAAPTYNPPRESIFNWGKKDGAEPEKNAKVDFGVSSLSKLEPKKPAAPARSKADEEESELDIPAFLRKKMD